jgi:tetratricopeptide (TPR) repeat protein
VGVGVRRDFFPESRAAFVLEHLPRARVFNDLAAGGYLAWRWHPERGVFVDGRTNAYPPELFKTMYGYEERARAEMSGLVPGYDSALTRALDVDPEERDLAWRKLVAHELSETMSLLTARYSLDTAVLYFYRDANPFWPAFDPYEWVVVHAEKSAMVLVRRRAGYGDLIARFEGNLGARGEAVFSKRLEAVNEVVRAASAANRALLDEAALSGQRRRPDRAASGGGVFRPSERAGLLMRRGNGHRVSRRYEQAAEDYRAALRIEPDSPEARLNLGFCLLALKRVEEARAEFARVRDLGHRKGYACYGLAECAESLGQEDEAARFYEEFLKSSGRSRSVDREKATKALEAIRDRQAR